MFTVKIRITDVAELTAIAETIFREHYTIGADAYLSEMRYRFEDEDFHLNENFAITKGLFNFTLNSYGVAPYYNNRIYLSMPTKQLSYLLKREVD